MAVARKPIAVKEVVVTPPSPVKNKPDGAPDCFGEYVVTGSPKCRKCWFAKECK